MRLTNCFLIGQDGKTSFHWAADNGHLDVVTKLLDSGADVHVKDNVRKFYLVG